jgi:hypothetical protein
MFVFFALMLIVLANMAMLRFSHIYFSIDVRISISSLEIGSSLDPFLKLCLIYLAFVDTH